MLVKLCRLDITTRFSKFMIFTGKQVGGIPALCFLLATRVGARRTPIQEWKIRQ